MKLKKLFWYAILMSYGITVIWYYREPYEKFTVWRRLVTVVFWSITYFLITLIDETN